MVSPHIHIDDTLRPNDKDALAKAIMDRHPELESQSVLERFPDIKRVVVMLESVYQTSMRNNVPCSVYHRLQIRNTDEYIVRLLNEDPDCVAQYKRIVSARPPKK